MFFARRVHIGHFVFGQGREIQMNLGERKKNGQLELETRLSLVPFFFPQSAATQNTIHSCSDKPPAFSAILMASLEFLIFHNECLMRQAATAENRARRPTWKGDKSLKGDKSSSPFFQQKPRSYDNNFCLPLFP